MGPQGEASRGGRGQEQSPLQLPEGTGPADTLILVPYDLFWVSDIPNSKTGNHCCFKPLHLWQLVKLRQT